MKSFSESFQPVYEILDAYKAVDTMGLQAISKNDEARLISCFSESFDEHRLSQINTPPSKKFSIFVDCAVTDVVATQSAMYSDFSFYVIQAISTVQPELEENPVLVGKTRQIIAANPSDWIKLHKYMVPTYFVDTLLKLKSSVENGSAMISPYLLDASGISNKNVSYVWPLVSDRNTVEINLTKFRDKSPLLYSGEIPSGFLQLKVPTLTGVPLDIVYKIRQDEQDAFSRFTRKFFKMVKEYEDGLDSEDALIESIHEVDDAIAKLKDDFQRIKKTKYFSSLDAGISMGVCCLCLLIPAEIGSFLAGLFGSRAGSGLIKSFSKYQNDVSEMKNSDFYIPWLIAHSAKDNS